MNADKKNNDLILENENIIIIGETMTKAILLEVCVHPKPGLVTSQSMGSHNDMSILTFMMSSAILARYFHLFAQIGNKHGDLRNMLNSLRNIGIEAETRLLEATKGVNTQRGILFAGGVLCGAAGYLVSRGKTLNAEAVSKTVSAIAEGIVDSELKNNVSDKKLTAGEFIYQRHGITGIRGEVEKGFPSVMNQGLPALKYALNAGINLNNCLLHTLLSLITCVEDSTILWRKDYDTLLQVQERAKRVLRVGSVFTSIGMQSIIAMENEFVNARISPGGSADLLSITIAMYLLENCDFPIDIL